MKKQKLFTPILSLLLALLVTTSAVANTDKTPITKAKAIEIAKSQINGKFINAEYDWENAVEVKLQTEKNGIVEVYVDLYSGEVLMMENETSDFGFSQTSNSYGNFVY